MPRCRLSQFVKLFPLPPGTGGVYKGRALLLAWPVRQGAKGHFPEDLHSTLVEQVQPLIPPGASVVVLGDGACDGMRLQHTVQQAGWAYVCRTGRHMTAWWQGEPLRRDTLGRLSRTGTLVALPDALLTEDAYGPVMLSCC